MTIQETDMKMLGEFILSILKPQFEIIENRFQNLETNFKNEIQNLRNDITGLKIVTSNLREDITRLSGEITKLDIDLRIEIKKVDQNIDSTAELIIRNTISDHNRLNNIERHLNLSKADISSRD